MTVSLAGRRHVVRLLVTRWGTCVAVLLLLVLLYESRLRAPAGRPGTPASAAAQLFFGALGSSTGKPRAQVKLSAAAGYYERRLCTDSCATARDGTCDEGRPGPGSDALPGAYYRVVCDLGTDCADCGPWQHRGSAAAAAWSPVTDILAKNFTLLARAADFGATDDGAARPSYVMPYTDPAQDVDVSRHMHDNGVVEHDISTVWYKVLSAGCVDVATGASRLVVDVGANFGWYTLLAATMGCRVIAFEPVPYFAAFLKYGLQRNGVSHMVQLRESIVGDVSGQELTMLVPNRGIWGTAGIGGRNLDANFKNEGDYDRVTKPTERVDEVVGEDVLLLKVDVEGFEAGVMRGASGLFRHHDVGHVIMEYSPGVAERTLDWVAFKQNPEMLMNLVNQGYTILHLFSGHLEGTTWEGPLPPLHCVTAGVLEHDLFDADQLSNGTLGCPLPPELADVEGMWRCNDIPEPFHPHSFRSTFGFNTNVWAFKRRPPFATVGPQASLFPAGYDFARQWFTPHEFGAAMRRCSTAVDITLAVASRCRCPDAEVCGRLEQLVERLAGEGKLVPAGPRPSTSDYKLEARAAGAHTAPGLDPKAARE